jgi:hypothetical protein
MTAAQTPDYSPTQLTTFARFVDEVLNPWPDHPGGEPPSSLPSEKEEWSPRWRFKLDIAELDASRELHRPSPFEVECEIRNEYRYLWSLWLMATTGGW